MKSVLIAEDEALIASFIEKGLRKNGFNTIIASDGEQAVLIAQEHKFDLLLLDLSLPIKDGWTVLNELKARDSQIPIIIVTAWDGIHHHHQGYDYIVKPFRFYDLLERAYNYLMD